jgi:hypothetical protein
MNYNSFLRSIPRIFSLRFLSSMFKNYNKNKVKFLIIGFQGFHKVQLVILTITYSVAVHKKFFKSKKWLHFMYKRSHSLVCNSLKNSCKNTK